MLEVHKFFGGDDFMDSFVGREKIKPDSDSNGANHSVDTTNDRSADTTNDLNGRQVDAQQIQLMT